MGHVNKQRKWDQKTTYVSWSYKFADRENVWFLLEENLNGNGPLRILNGNIFAIMKCKAFGAFNLP